MSWSGGAHAQTVRSIGCTATTDCASTAVALQEGIFKKNGLDVAMTLNGINSNIPAALLSNSVQIGDPTPPAFLQAVDGELDHVGIEGAGSTLKTTFDTAGVVVAAAGPMMSRIIASGTGTVAGNFPETLPERRPAILYASTREWPDANCDAIAALPGLEQE